jgi:hypothetical protein
MPTMDQERCTSSTVYCPWPRPEALTWTRSRRQRDYIYSFCRMEQHPESVRSKGIEPRQGRRRPIRIVPSRRGLELVSLADAIRNRVARVSIAWRVTAGIIVLLSLLELFLASHVPNVTAGSSPPNAALPSPSPAGEFGVTTPRFGSPSA